MKGAFDATFRGLRSSVADMLVQGQGAARCGIRVDLDRRVSTLTAVGIDLSEVGMQVGDQSTEGWWMKVQAPEVTAHGFPPGRVDGRLAMQAKSAEPLLKFLVAKGKIPGIVPKVTSLEDVRAAGTFRQDAQLTDVVLEPLKNVLFNLAGRYYSKGKEQRYAFVVGGKAFSVGIADEGNGLEAQLFAREGWLNSKLEGLPAPKKQVHSPEP